MGVMDEQWSVIEPFIIRPSRRADGKGRPWQDDRPLLTGMFWILRTGAPWPDLPERYPPYQHVHHRFQAGIDNGTCERILTRLADDLLERGQRDLRACFIDGTVVGAPQGAPAWERPRGAQGRRSWHVQTAILFRSPSPVRLRRHRTSPVLIRRSTHGLSQRTLRI